MPGIFDGFANGIFDDAIFDTQIQDTKPVRKKISVGIRV